MCICICICIYMCVYIYVYIYIYAIYYTLDGSDPSDTHCEAQVCICCIYIDR